MSPTTTNSSSPYSFSLDLAKDFGLTQYVTQPTRTTTHQANVLDLIFFCNRSAIIFEVSIIPGTSDHQAVIANLKCHVAARPPPRAGQIYMYSRGDYRGFHNQLVEYLAEFEHTDASCNADSL